MESGGGADGRESRAHQLRRTIELYRRYLSEGVDADMARIYLRELAIAEAALASIEEGRR
jgi:hypothetical protein